MNGLVANFPGEILASSISGGAERQHIIPEELWLETV